MIKFFNPAKQYKTLRKEILGAIDKTLSNGDLILRDDVEKFENKLAKFVGTKYAVGLNSGTDAIFLALKSLGIGEGDEVLVPYYTFKATVSCVVNCGATPVFFDLDGNIEFTKKTKAIIPAHLEGNFQADMSYLVDQCSKRGVYVIEDACQSLGATQYEQMAGSFGDVGCFSFYPAKLLGCPGDGGALVTNNKEVYDYVKDARNHFKDTDKDWGWNSRLDNVWASVLNIKFKYFTEILLRRHQIANMYKAIKTVQLPAYTDGRVWQDYIIRTPKRDELYTYLKKNGVETLKNEYPFPVEKGKLTAKYESETLRIPCNETLTNTEVKKIISLINKFDANTV